MQNRKKRYVSGLVGRGNILGGSRINDIIKVWIKGRIIMRGGCQEHRKWMELLGLQLQLKNGDHDPETKKEIEQRIKALEKELGVD